MSSPLHSLKKNKIPLFPGHMAGHRPIPFRHPEYSEDESRLLEEVTALMVQEKRKRDPFAGLPQINPASSLNPATGTRNDLPTTTNTDGFTDPPTDHDLMRMMMNKIAFLEQQVTTQKEDIRVKDRRIKVLEDKLKIVEKSQGCDTGIRATSELEKHCLLLQQQVHEMETFLAEYGMVWVGEDNNDNSDVYLNASVQVDGDDEDDFDDDDNDVNNTENSRHVSGPTVDNSSKRPIGSWQQENSFVSDENATPVHIDFDLLVENIKDLNVLAGEGVAQIKKTSDGARFEIPDPVQLTLYANGILMFNGPFRPYIDPSTRLCVQDLLDGYFPSELQQRFPDGIPFQLTDLRGVTYLAKSAPRVFAGEGQTLGGESKPSRLIPSKFQDPVNWNTGQDADTNTPTTSEFPGRMLTQPQFLAKLPKSVVKDGKVIDVRNSISNTLTGKADNDNKQSNITLLTTNVTKEMTESVANVAALSGKTSSGPRPKSYTGHRDVTTLRVVTENGDHTYIVKMKFKETIGNLRSYLDSHRRPKVPYDIVSTFPHKVHKNNTSTLEDSGLTPNAVLHLKPCK